MTTELTQLEPPDENEKPKDKDNKAALQADPFASINQVRSMTNLPNPENNQFSGMPFSPLMQTEKPKIEDLDVIRDWIDEKNLSFITRIMSPYEMSVLETLIPELTKFDKEAGEITARMVQNHKRNMVAFEGKRVLEQIEGLRARKQTEEIGFSGGKGGGLRSFLMGDKSTV